MPYPELKGLLTDIGTEELSHLEMVGTIVHQLTRNLNEEQIRTAGFDAYFVDHTTGVFPQFASGFPWSAATMQVTGDVLADLTEDMAADGAMLLGRKSFITALVFLLSSRVNLSHRTSPLKAANAAHNKVYLLHYNNSLFAIPSLSS